MRRKDREIINRDDIIDIIKKCDVIRLAFNAEGAPYILPLNFGILCNQNDIVFYFHSANEGRKLDLMLKNPNVGFEADCSHKLITGKAACDYSMEYESIIGSGELLIIEDYDEKIMGLDLIMDKYSGKNGEKWSYNENMVKNVTIFKLIVSEITGKRHL